MVDWGRGFRSLRVTDWVIWTLPPTLRLYVCGVITAAVATAGWTAAATSWRARDVALWGLLVAFGVVVVELGRKVTPPEPAGLIKDIFAAWLLPMAILLPPVYGLVAPAITFAMLQLRTRRTIAHRRVFSAAVNGLTLAAVSSGIHTLPVTPRHSWWWLLAAVGCAVAWLMASTALMGTASWLTDRTVSVRSELLAPAPLLNDTCELAAGVLIAGLVAWGGLVLLIPALPLVAVLARSFRAAQLDTRIDPQTGLLRAVAWRAEVEVLLARARRDGKSLTIVIVRLGLASVNAVGELARDAALTAAAATVSAGVRPYDVTGRLGPQIVVGLPDTTADEARKVAARLHDSLAAQLAAAPGQESACIEVTLGLAVTDAPPLTDLRVLLHNADAALYRAQQEGLPYVCLEAEDPALGDLQEEIDAARRTLAELLIKYRDAAGLTQVALAARIPYARSTLAGAESKVPGAKAPAAEFWVACGQVLGVKEKLKAAYARYEALIAMQAARRRADRQAQRRVVEPENTLAIASAPAPLMPCPHCGGSLAVVTGEPVSTPTSTVRRLKAQ